MRKIINISKEFTTTPGPRYIYQGDKSGEQFRTEKLLPAYLNARKDGIFITIELDGVYGYPPSFLEESFGGLVRITKDSPEKIKKLLEFKCEARPYLKEKIYKYIDDAWRNIK